MNERVHLKSPSRPAPRMRVPTVTPAHPIRTTRCLRMISIQVRIPSPNRNSQPYPRKLILTSFFSIAASHPEAPAESSPRGPDSGSQSSTVVDPASYNGSMMTLINEGSIYEIPEDAKDPKFFLKESIRYSSPLVHAISPAMTPCVMSARKDLPFAPEDLTRALIAVQVCA